MTATPLQLLSKIVPRLRERRVPYAVAGGLAASFYRARPRLTNDVDIAIDAGDQERSKSVATEVLEELELKVSLEWIAGGADVLGSPIALVVRQLDAADYEATIDMLLPSLPWLQPAVRRAQANQIDFGFAMLPTITPEDLIVAKAFALSLEPNRYSDLDDIQSICRSSENLDLLLLVEEFERLKLSLPRALDEVLPSALRRIVKANRGRR